MGKVNQSHGGATRLCICSLVFSSRSDITAQFVGKGGQDTGEVVPCLTTSPEINSIGVGVLFD